MSLHSPELTIYVAQRSSEIVRFMLEVKNDSSIDLRGLAWWLIWNVSQCTLPLRPPRPPKPA